MEASVCPSSSQLLHRPRLASRHQTSSSQHLIRSSTNRFKRFKGVKAALGTEAAAVTVTLPASFFVLDTKEKVPERREQVRERSARSDKQEDRTFV